MFIIQSTEGGLPLYYSDDFKIHPAGTWGDKEDAKRFDAEPEAKEYIKKKLFHQAEMCKVVPL